MRSFLSFPTFAYLGALAFDVVIAYYAFANYGDIQSLDDEAGNTPAFRRYLDEERATMAGQIILTGVSALRLLWFAYVVFGGRPLESLDHPIVYLNQLWTSGGCILINASLVTKIRFDFEDDYESLAIYDNVFTHIYIAGACFAFALMAVSVIHTVHSDSMFEFWPGVDDIKSISLVARYRHTIVLLAFAFYFGMRWIIIMLDFSAHQEDNLSDTWHAFESIEPWLYISAMPFYLFGEGIGLIHMAWFVLTKHEPKFATESSGWVSHFYWAAPLFTFYALGVFILFDAVHTVDIFSYLNLILSAIDVVSVFCYLYVLYESGVFADFRSSTSYTRIQ